MLPVSFVPIILHSLIFFLIVHKKVATSATDRFTANNCYLFILPFSYTAGAWPEAVKSLAGNSS